MSIVNLTEPHQPANTVPPARALSSPLCFTSSLVPRVWGGRALGSVLKHSLPNDEPYGEAWDISGLHGYISRVADGPHVGCLLTDLWNDHRAEFAGTSAANESEFPLLIKWLDCRERLSVQVHPDDHMARTVLGQARGKSEVWIVLEADATARVIAGLRPGVSRDMFIQHLKAGTLEECLHSFTPRAGDCIVLPAGTIHAAGGGLLIAEVQQSSDATFRLFDWNRLGLDGQPRALQLDLALQAMDWTQGAIHPVRMPAIETQDAEDCGESLAEFPSFRLERYTLTRTRIAPHPDELTIWMVLEGAVRVAHPQSGEDREIPRGRTLVIPAAAGNVVMSPIGQDVPVTLLCARLPRTLLSGATSAPR